MSYPWIKTLHILFVIAWMAAVFYLPRILVNVAEVGDAVAIRERLLLMGRRLYKFGHIMFAFMLLFGMTLWMHFKIAGPWLHAKLVLVAILFAFFIHSGRYLKKAAAGAALPSSVFFRWYNEIALVLAIPIIYLAVAKSF